MPIIQNFDALNQTPERKIILDLIETGLESIQPENIFKKNIKREGNILFIKEKPTIWMILQIYTS